MDSKKFAKFATYICSIIDKTLRKISLNDSFHYYKPAIYCFWHGNEFPMLMSNQKKSIVIMVSLSKDGELLSKILQSFGYLTIRGSSSKGGKRALIEIVKYGRKGHNIAFAADGPKGPYHRLKSGVVYAAQKTGMPIIPISCSPKNKIVINQSWDKAIIPLPFSKMVQIYGEPIYVNSDDVISDKKVLVEKNLNKLFEFTGKHYWNKDVLKYLEYHPAPKILIIQPSRIGDIMFSLPLLVAVKKKYPTSRISWIVDERCAEILENNPNLENIFVWDRKQFSFKYYKNLRCKLKKHKFDLSIDLHGLAKSAVFVRLANAKFKIASSSTNGMREFSWMFSKEIKSSDSEQHCVERHLEVAKFLNCTHDDSDTSYLPVTISKKNFKDVLEKLIKEGILCVNNIVGIHPGGGWISRRWESYKFAILAKKLKTELNAEVVLVGGKEGGASEKDLSKEILDNSQVKIIDMTGKFTLKELFAFLKMCKVFVGNEAGPIHIATALNVQSVAILGPTNAKRTGPYKGNTKVIQHKVCCQPCRNKTCKKLTCMRYVTISEVFEEIRKKYGNFDN
jgi:lipopolysaccharide heptosyltransferase II